MNNKSLKVIQNYQRLTIGQKHFTSILSIEKDIVKTGTTRFGQVRSFPFCPTHFCQCNFLKIKLEKDIMIYKILEFFLGGWGVISNDR